MFDCFKGALPFFYDVGLNYLGLYNIKKPVRPQTYDGLSDKNKYTFKTGHKILLSSR